MSIGYRILIYVLLLTALVGGLFRWGYVDGTAAQKIRGDAVIATQKAAYDKTVAEATAARDVAELRALNIERLSTKQLADLAAGYEQEIANEKAAADVRAAQFRNGDRRLRVALSAAAACGSAVPGTPGSPGGSDGAATAELSGEAAAGLDGLAGEADGIVGQLTLAQKTIASYVAQFGSHE